MPIFLNRGPVALFALSLAAFVPLTAVAQDTATPTEDTAPQPVAGLTADGTVPNGWDRYTRFGLNFALPPAMQIQRDRTLSSGMEFEASDAPADAATGTTVNVSMLTPQMVADLSGAIGSDEFAAQLSRRVGVPVARTDAVVMLGDVALQVYRGSGEVEGPDRAPLPSRALFLIAETALDNGSHPVVTVATVGLPETDAIATEAQTVASLAAPDAGALGRVIHVGLVDGVSQITVAEDIYIAAIDTNPNNRSVFLAHAEAPDLVHTSLGSWQPGLDADTLTAALLRRFSTLDAVEEGTHLGVPVWILSGESLNTAGGTRATDEGPRARYMITQSCLPDDGGPVVLGVITTATRGAPVILDAIANTMSLNLPDGATPCPPEIGAALNALPIGAIDHPAPPEPEVPTVAWVEHQRFGMRLMAPEGMTVRRDRETADRREYWLTNIDEDTGIGADIVLRVFTSAQRLAVSDAPVDSDAFEAVLERLGSMPLERTGETTQIGGMNALYFRGTNTRERNGVTRDQRLLYVINTQPSATGLNPWLAVLTSGMTEAESRAFEETAIAGIQLADTAQYNGSAVETVLDGVARIAVAPGLVLAQSIPDSDGGTVLIADAATPDTVHTLYGIEAREDGTTDTADAVSRRLASIDAITESQVDDVPVWIFDGRAAYAPDRARMAEGQTSPARLVITQSCLPGAGPLMIGLLATEARLEAAGGFDALLAPVRVTLPDGSAACPPELQQALAAIRVTGRARIVLPEMPPVPDSGKPGDAPVAAVDPEPAAWSSAEAADTAQAMTDYLDAFPTGAHAQDAREWLAMHAPRPIDDDAATWQRAATAGTPAGFWTYLKAHPQGQYAQVARAALDALLRAQSSAPAPQPPAQPQGKRA